VITCWIGTTTCCIGDGKLTHTRNSLGFQFLIIISTISSNRSLSRSILYHHLWTRCEVIYHHLSMPRWRVHKGLSIHWILHHPLIDHLALPASLSPSTSQLFLFYWILYIPTIWSSPMNSVSAHCHNSHPIYHLQSSALQSTTFRPNATKHTSNV
jgi:hypothetical protein